MLRRNKFKILKWVLLLSFIVIAFSFFSKGMDEEIPIAENQYINNILSKITAESSKADVVNLLGEPDRNLALKSNWWVIIDDRKSRIGVYFSSTTGKATRINFDGGTGRFYYRKDLE